MTELRFCLYQYQHRPLPELRWRRMRAEALGLDVLWNVDTVVEHVVVEPDTPGAMTFDGPSTLVQMALATSRIRVGTLAITSRYADSWSSWGGCGLASEAELFRLTRNRSLRLSDLCAELGRGPVGATGPSASTSTSCTGRGLGTRGQARKTPYSSTSCLMSRQASRQAPVGRGYSSCSAR